MTRTGMKPDQSMDRNLHETSTRPWSQQFPFPGPELGPRSRRGSCCAAGSMHSGQTDWSSWFLPPEPCPKGAKDNVFSRKEPKIVAP